MCEFFSANAPVSGLLVSVSPSPLFCSTAAAACERWLNFLVLLEPTFSVEYWLDLDLGLSQLGNPKDFLFGTPLVNNWEFCHSSSSSNLFAKEKKTKFSAVDPKFSRPGSNADAAQRKIRQRPSAHRCVREAESFQEKSRR